MKSNLPEEIANSVGGNFSNTQVGEPGNIAGMVAPLGCRTPTTKNNCMPERHTRNKKDQERISKLVALLMGKQLAPEELSEKKGGTSLAVAGAEGKAISGLGGQSALSLPPGKNIAVKPNKLTTGVNGLKTDTPTIARVVSDLIKAKERFPSMNLDPARCAIDGNYTYKVKNVTTQADQYNNLRGIEMVTFFRSDEDSTTDELVNDTLKKHFDKHKIG
tara:strand:+ start:461 stop:1114 length:654 start_codon:yes stop_codon:yes gene_type:complete